MPEGSGIVARVGMLPHAVDMMLVNKERNKGLRRHHEYFDKLRAPLWAGRILRPARLSR